MIRSRLPIFVSLQLNEVKTINPHPIHPKPILTFLHSLRIDLSSVSLLIRPLGIIGIIGIIGIKNRLLSHKSSPERPPNLIQYTRIQSLPFYLVSGSIYHRHRCSFGRYGIPKPRFLPLLMVCEISQSTENRLLSHKSSPERPPNPIQYIQNQSLPSYIVPGSKKRLYPCSIGRYCNVREMFGMFGQMFENRNPPRIVI